jgi:hypothetical protein
MKKEAYGWSVARAISFPGHRWVDPELFGEGTIGIILSILFTQA